MYRVQLNGPSLEDFGASVSDSLEVTQTPEKGSWVGGCGDSLGIGFARAAAL